MGSRAFRPEWASAPGDTIVDVLTERGLELDSLPDLLGVNASTADALLSGEAHITLELARRLSSRMGSSTEFWMTRDAQYRDDLLHVDTLKWMEALPLREMRLLGWIEPHGNAVEQAAECLRFFDVKDLVDWRAHYEPLVASAKFRGPSDLQRKSEAVAAWLRRGQIAAAEIACAPWNPGALRDALPAVRGLTRVKDPAVFLPRLTKLGANCGVAVVIVRPPTRFPISGAAHLLLPDRAMIALTARYLTDDHLWFTFFHEVAHLLLHNASQVYVDDLDQRPAASEAVVDFDEVDANRFAQEQLVPTAVLAALAAAPISLRRVVRIARELGVAPGVVVGQLQHKGMLAWSRLNGAKRRYRWNASTLEMG